MREEVKKILKFWLDLGVDGFREDVITLISKKEGLPSDHLFPIYKGIRFYNHEPHIHEYLSEFRRDVLSHYDCMTIAEAPLIWPKRALEYISEKEDSDFDMMIQFECMCGDCFFTDYMPTKFHLRKLKRAWSSWQSKLEGKAWNMLYLENHDHPRVISRYGSEKIPRRERQNAGRGLSVPEGNALPLSGTGDRHDELAAGRSGTVRGCADALAVRTCGAEKRRPRSASSASGAARAIPRGRRCSGRTQSTPDSRRPSRGSA